MEPRWASRAGARRATPRTGRAPPGDGAGAGTPAGRRRVVAACVCGVCALCACVCGMQGHAGLTVRGMPSARDLSLGIPPFYLFFIFFKRSTRLAVGQHPDFAECFVEDTRQRATLPSVI